MKDLNLTANKLGDIGLKVLLKMFSSCSKFYNIQILNISNNGFTS